MQAAGSVSVNKVQHSCYYWYLLRCMIASHMDSCLDAAAAPLPASCFTLHAGLDALMLVKTMTFGLQLFVPISFVGLVVLCPVHASGKYLANDEAGNKVGGLRRLRLVTARPHSHAGACAFPACMYA